jgi:hypothetical protein
LRRCLHQEFSNRAVKSIAPLASPLACLPESLFYAIDEAREVGVCLDASPVDDIDCSNQGAEIVNYEVAS